MVLEAREMNTRLLSGMGDIHASVLKGQGKFQLTTQNNIYPNIPSIISDKYGHLKEFVYMWAGNKRCESKVRLW